eukprot:gene11964-2184_t
MRPLWALAWTAHALLLSLVPCPASDVVFELHPSFTDPVRSVDRPPYESVLLKPRPQISEYGWGEFDIKIRVYCVETDKPVELVHYLRLYPPDQAPVKPTGLPPPAKHPVSKHPLAPCCPCADLQSPSAPCLPCRCIAPPITSAAWLVLLHLVVSENYEELVFASPSANLQESLKRPSPGLMPGACHADILQYAGGFDEAKVPSMPGQLAMSSTNCADKKTIALCACPPYCLPCLYLALAAASPALAAASPELESLNRARDQMTAAVDKAIKESEANELKIAELTRDVDALRNEVPASSLGSTPASFRTS